MCKNESYTDINWRMKYGLFTQELQTEKKHKWNLLRYMYSIHKLLKPNGTPFQMYKLEACMYAFPVIFVSISPHYCTSIVI